MLSFVEAVEQLCNPFIATGQELVALDTQEVMEQEVVISLSQVHEVGQALQAEYISQRLDRARVPDTIARNQILTFANHPDPTKKAKKNPKTVVCRSKI